MGLEFRSSAPGPDGGSDSWPLPRGMVCRGHGVPLSSEGQAVTGWIQLILQGNRDQDPRLVGGPSRSPPRTPGPFRPPGDLVLHPSPLLTPHLSLPFSPFSPRGRQMHWAGWAQQ